MCDGALQCCSQALRVDGKVESSVLYKVGSFASPDAKRTAVVWLSRLQVRQHAAVRHRRTRLTHISKVPYISVFAC